MADTEIEPAVATASSKEIDYTSKFGRAQARHRISEIDLEIAHLEKAKANIRAKLAGKE